MLKMIVTHADKQLTDRTAGCRSPWRLPAPILFVLIVFLLNACAGSELQVRPDGPKPRESVSLNPQSLVIQDSLLSTSVTADLSSLRTSAEKKLSELFSKGTDADDSKSETGTEAGLTKTNMQDDGSYILRKVTYEQPKASFEDTTLYVRIDTKLSAAWVGLRGENKQVLDSCGCSKKMWCGGSNQKPVTITAKWKVPLKLRSMWTLSGEPTLEFADGDGCVLRRTRSITFDVRNEFQQSIIEEESVGKTLKRVIAEDTAIQDVVMPFWKGLATPVSPDEEHNGKNVLLFRPRAMAADMFRIVDDVATIKLLLAASPVLAPAESINHEAVGWPPPSTIGEAEGFRVVSEVRIPTAMLAASIKKMLVNQRFPNRTTRYVKIDSVDVYGSEEHATIKLGFDGSASGDIFLSGHLDIDSDRDELTLNNIELTPDSAKALSVLYDQYERPDYRIVRRPWIRGPELAEEVTRAARFPLRRHFVTMRRTLQSAKKKAAIPGHSLWIGIEDMDLGDVAMDKESARLLVVMNCRAILDEKQPKAP